MVVGQVASRATRACEGPRAWMPQGFGRHSRVRGLGLLATCRVTWACPFSPSGLVDIARRLGGYSPVLSLCCPSTTPEGSRMFYRTYVLLRGWWHPHWRTEGTVASWPCDSLPAGFSFACPAPTTALAPHTLAHPSPQSLGAGVPAPSADTALGARPGPSGR